MSFGDDAESGYLREVLRHPPLDAERERELATRALAGDAGARRDLVEANLWLVVEEARRVGSDARPLLERVEEGNLGLMAAATAFDLASDKPFREQARRRVRDALSRARETRAGVEQSGESRCPGCARAGSVALRVLEVPEDGGDGVAQVLFLFCRACGHTLDDLILPDEG